MTNLRKCSNEYLYNCKALPHCCEQAMGTIKGNLNSHANTNDRCLRLVADKYSGLPHSLICHHKISRSSSNVLNDASCCVSLPWDRIELTIGTTFVHLLLRHTVTTLVHHLCVLDDVLDFFQQGIGNIHHDWQVPRLTQHLKNFLTLATPACCST